MANKVKAFDLNGMPVEAPAVLKHPDPGFDPAAVWQHDDHEQGEPPESFRIPEYENKQTSDE